jgi:cytochrome c nitrite reductase small subunit
MKLPLVAGIAFGVLLGIGGFTFIYARGASYLTNDPAACANCHVMRDYYSAWQKSSHRSVAVCNDCHTPAGFIPKYFTKAKNGFWHSYYFTTGSYPDNIQITPGNREIADVACQKCHATFTQLMAPGPHGQPTGCVRCHGAVGHRMKR